MSRRDLLKLISFSLLPFESFAGILDAFKKTKPVDLSKYTPQDKLYIVDIKGVPDSVKNSDLKNYRLKVFGDVQQSFEYTYQDILSMDFVEKDIILECVSNAKGDKIGKIKVKGVLLSKILEISKPLKNSKEVVFRSFDGYHTSIEIDYINQYNPVLVYQINADEDGRLFKPLNLDHGYPLRVVCPEKWGYKSAKWIKEIEVVSYDYKGYWEKQGWSDRAIRGKDYFDIK